MSHESQDLNLSHTGNVLAERTDHFDLKINIWSSVCQTLLAAILDLGNMAGRLKRIRDDEFV